MKKNLAQQIFNELKRAIPNPQSELKFSTTFELLVAVILSAHTTDKSVNQATAKLFPVANTPEKILSLGRKRLMGYIKNIGLYQAKSLYLLKTSQILVEKHNSKVPNSRKELEALPGVGRKTANVVLNIAFGEATIAVDTHIFRVCNRTGLAPGKTPLKVEQELFPIVPKDVIRDAHHLLLLHGRYTCTARKPKCGECPIFRYCQWDSKQI